jgi:fermentation-respiration switch protein FrsA (DUF1100 family)
MPTVLYMEDTIGFDWALWFDTTGTLRTAQVSVVEAPAFDWNSGGTPIGGQTLIGGLAAEGDKKPDLGPKVVPPPPAKPALPVSGKPEKSA